MRRGMQAMQWFAAAVVLTVTVVAGQGQSQQKSQEPSKGSDMSMDGMMKGCREHCQATSKSMEQMAAAMEEAKQSNDPAKMRAAMDGMQKPMADMKEHMGMCMRMMGMMQNMQGQSGMGGMMQDGQMGMMQRKPELKMATSPAELDELCGRNVGQKTAPSATHQGKIYYFCAEADKATFQKNPAKYVK